MEHVRDLTQLSREELKDMLLRQEKILSNKRLIQTLPDKGKKIKDFAEKICQALEHHEEAERKQRLVSVARTEFQSKYHQAFTIQQCPERSTTITVSAPGEVSQERKDSSAVACEQETEQELFSAFGVTRMTLNSDQAQETALVEALERVTLSTGSSAETKKVFDRKAMDNYIVKTQSTAKPHYLSVIEKMEKTPLSKKPQFKTNQLPNRDDISPSGSWSPSQSSETSSPLSAQARRESDRKHLDDITAAKLPPLHHSPAQLLSLEESAVLLREQTKKHQELQAKLAAQKLSEGLKISMGSYTPDGGPMAAYREVHDEGAQFSSEED